MGHTDESFDEALETISQELTAARLPQENPTLEAIQSRIKTLQKEVDSPDAAERLRQLRADLLAYIQQIEKAAGEAAESARTTPITPEQRQIVDQRIAACMEYALGQAAREKNSRPGGLAWLARLRV